MTRKKEDPAVTEQWEAGKQGPADALLSATRDELELDKLRTEIEKARLDLKRTQRQEADDLADRAIRRRIQVINGIDSYSALGVIHDIDLASAQNPGAELEMHIHSPGGMVFAGLSIHDRVIRARQQGHSVTTIAHGYAASMAGILLQSGETRVMMPDAYLMIHEVASGVIGKLSEMTDETELAKRLQGRLFDILAERSVLTARQIRARATRKDWWLDANQALKLGFIDQIGLC